MQPATTNTKILLPVTCIKGEKASGFNEVYVDIVKFVNKHVRDYEINGVAVKNRCVVFSSFQKNDKDHSESIIIELSKEDLIAKLKTAGFNII